MLLFMQKLISCRDAQFLQVMRYFALFVLVLKKSTFFEKQTVLNFKIYPGLPLLHGDHSLAGSVMLFSCHMGSEKPTSKFRVSKCF